MLPLLPRALDDVADGVRGVEQQVEHHLVDVADVAVHRRQLAEVGLDFGDALVFVARHVRAST